MGHSLRIMMYLEIGTSLTNDEHPANIFNVHYNHKQRVVQKRRSVTMESLSDYLGAILDYSAACPEQYDRLRKTRRSRENREHLKRRCRFLETLRKEKIPDGLMSCIKISVDSFLKTLGRRSRRLTACHQDNPAGIRTMVCSIVTVCHQNGRREPEHRCGDDDYSFSERQAAVPQSC